MELEIRAATEKDFHDTAGYWLGRLRSRAARYGIEVVVGEPSQQCMDRTRLETVPV